MERDIGVGDPQPTVCQGHEEINLLTWFELHQSLLSSTAGTLIDTLKIIKRRRITPNICTLKEEKRPAIVLSKSIIIGFHDAICRAVQELQNLDCQMSQELRSRFNLPEDWLESASLVPSVAISVVSGPAAIKNTKLSEGRAPDLPTRKEPTQTNANCPQNTGKVSVTPKHKLTPEEHNIPCVGRNNCNPNLIPAGKDASAKSVNYVPKKMRKPGFNSDKHRQSGKEHITVQPPTPTTSQASPPVVAMSPKPSDIDGDNDDSIKTCIVPSRANLLTQGIPLQKKIKKEPADVRESGYNPNRPVEVKHESLITIQQVRRELLQESGRNRPSYDVSNTANRGAIDNPKDNLDLPARACVAFPVKKVILNVDNHDTQTEILSQIPKKLTSVKPSWCQTGNVRDKKEAAISPQASLKPNRSNLARSTSSELRRKDPSLLLEGVPAVVVEKLSPRIEKALGKDGFVQLTHFNKMKCREGQDIDLPDSDSTCESGESLKEFRMELKVL